MTHLSYDFLVPPITAFGSGRLAEIGELARRLGDRAFLVTGSRALERDGVVDRIEGLLADAGVEPVRLCGIHREPTVSDVDGATRRLRSMRDSGRTGGDVVIGIGGGAALDLAKAAGAMAAFPAESGDAGADSVRDCLEGVGRGVPVRSSLPVLAVPTTAGTGSECTKNAVVSSDEGESPPFKKSLRSPAMVPRAVLIDPELTVSLPPDVTARSGMDAITQLIESAISSRAKPIPRALARHGLELAVPAIETAVREPADLRAREAMAHAAYLSGIALANSGLGMAHGVAAALGVIAGVPHGLACAVMLPAALEANRDARATDIAAFARLLSRRSFDSDAGAAEAAAELVRELNARIGIPGRLGDLGVRAEQLPAIVAGSRGNSMNGNPRAIDDAELTAILEAML